MSWADVDIMQTLNPIAETGAKHFGAGLAAGSLDNPNAKNKNELIFIIGIGAAVGLFFFFMRSRK